jgi:hypothetical protein
LVGSTALGASVAFPATTGSASLFTWGVAGVLALIITALLVIAAMRIKSRRLIAFLVIVFLAPSSLDLSNLDMKHDQDVGTHWKEI